MKNIKLHDIRKNDLIQDQNERINKTLRKEIDIECTFKPEINKKLPTKTNEIKDSKEVKTDS